MCRLHGDCFESFRGRSRKGFDVSDATEAQKKFGNAKAISSDQFFNKNDPDVSFPCSSVVLRYHLCYIFYKPRRFLNEMF